MKAFLFPILSKYMSVFQPIYHAVSGSVYWGMAGWEIYTSVSVPVPMDINDVARCFLLAISVMNILMGIQSWYICYVQCRSDKERKERQAVNAATGLSVWGLCLYFRYTSLIQAEYLQILLAEMCLFFIRIGITIILVCVLCQPSPLTQSIGGMDMDGR